MMDYKRKQKFESLAFRGEVNAEGPQKILEMQIQELHRQAPLRWAAIIALFLLTGLVTYFTIITVRQNAVTEFNKLTSEISAQLQRRVNEYANAVLAMRALFSASTEVTKSEFHDFYQSMRRSVQLPGLKRLSYVTIGPRADKGEYHPKFAEPAFELENPFDSSIAAAGTLSAYFQIARDDGDIVATAAIDSNGPETGSNVVAFISPVYKSNLNPAGTSEQMPALLGYLIAEVRVDDFLGDAVKSQLRANDIAVEVLRRNLSGENASLLKAYPLNSEWQAGNSDFVRAIEFNVAQMVWSAKFSVLPYSKFFSGARTVVLLVLCSGIVVATIISYLLLTSYRSRQRLLYFAKRKTKDVEEVNDLLRQILDSIPAPVLLKNEDLQVLIWNRAFEELSGIKREELLGLTGYESFPADELDGYFEIDREVLASQKLVAVEELLTTKSGEKRIIVTKKVPIRAKYGTYYLLGISEDVTGQRRRENQRSSSEAIRKN